VIGFEQFKGIHRFPLSFGRLIEKLRTALSKCGTILSRIGKIGGLRSQPLKMYGADTVKLWGISSVQV
jgi:hypothetical protein